MEFRIAQSALDDLKAIQAWYCSEGVPHIGEQRVNSILKQCERLLLHPDSGRKVPEFDRTDIRELIHAPFRVVYFRQANQITFIRVWRSERLLRLPDYPI